MAKISVVEAARELNQNPEEFLRKLKEMGIYADDVQATIDTDQIPRVRALLKEEEKGRNAGTFVERRIGTTVIRRRSRAVSQKAGAESATEEIPQKDIPDSADAAEIPVAGAGAGDASVPSSAEEPFVAPDRIEQAPSAETAPGADSVAQPVQTGAAELQAQEEELAEDEDASSGVIEEESEDEVQGTGDDRTRIMKRPKKFTKVLNLRGHTPEPAKVISRPVKPVPAKAGVEPPPAMGAEAVPTKEVPERRGRRVVEINRTKEYGSKRKTKEQALQESRLETQRRKRRDFKQTEITTPKASKRKIRIEGAINVSELAHRMAIKSGDLIKKLFEMGQMVTINQSLDVDSATIIASEYGFEIEDTALEPEMLFDATPDDAEKLVPRHPVVTVMGHVDHGKTTLLDAIRTTNVVAGEAGGITQHIGAYKVNIHGRSIAFIDTPGHESFTTMRARGAQATDIVILVVAADDGVMPQTVEAINHAKDAKVPIVVAINKIDKEGANIDRIMSALADHGLVSEAWGGDTQFARISAKKREGISEILDKVLLQADILDLKANPDKKASGVVLEARLEKGRGPVATILVKEGTLRVGDPMVAGPYSGRVRFMHDDVGNRIEAAGPADPVEVVGLGGVPAAGDRFFVAENEKTAKQVAEAVLMKAREIRTRKMAKVSLENLFEQIQEESVKELKIILKGDVQGSVEAVTEALNKLTTHEVKVNVVHAGVGAITETDINFAIASTAIVIGFGVRPPQEIKELAQREGVQIKTYTIIYELIDDITLGMEGLLEPVQEEVFSGRAEVREIFSISRIGTIAGSYVTDGKILRNGMIRVLRDKQELFSGRIASLKRFKDDAREVPKGMECGIQIEGFNDLLAGDILESYTIEQVAGKLGQAISG